MIELQAYAAYVMALAGKPQRAVMGRLSEVVRMTDAGSARFHLAAAWLAAGRRDVAAGLIPARPRVSMPGLTRSMAPFRMTPPIAGHRGSAVSGASPSVAPARPAPGKPQANDPPGYGHL